MPTIVIKTPDDLAAEKRRSRSPEVRKPTYSPLTVTQALAIRALVPPHRTLRIEPPRAGTIRLAYDILLVKYQTFKRLRALDALDLDKDETGAGPAEIYRLSKHGHALWAEHCRVDGTPTRDPAID